MERDLQEELALRIAEEKREDAITIVKAIINDLVTEATRAGKKIKTIVTICMEQSIKEFPIDFSTLY